MTEYLNIEALDINQLNDLIKRHPWFSYAIHTLLVKLYAINKEAFGEELKKSAVFLSSRGALYNRLHNRSANIFTDTQPAVPQEKTKYVAVGGDYFTQKDFDELQKEEPANPEPAKLPDSKEDREKVNFQDLTFYTETLGNIYASQGYYDMAIDVFSKLILVYPQKNAYFAALISKLKKQKEETLKKKEN